MGLTGAALLVAAAWSTPAQFSGPDDFGGPGPQAAIAADGTSYTAWRDYQRGIFATSGRAGRFTRPRRVARSGFQVATAAATGRAALVYTTRKAIYIAVRGAPVRRVFGQPADTLRIVADPLGGWVVVAEVDRRIHAWTLDDRGRRLAGQDLGRGFFAFGPSQRRALVVAADGRAYVAIQQSVRGQYEPYHALVGQRPHGGAWTVEPVPGQAPTDDIQQPTLALAPTGVNVAALRTTSCGEAGCSGFPLSAPLGQPLTGPPQPNPNRAFGPVAAPTGMIFQLKTKKASFSHVAPVWAGTQQLTKAPATEPLPLALANHRALVLWTTAKGWDAALAGPDGVYRPTEAPSGPAPRKFHSGEGNRAADSAGEWAILAWGNQRTVRISVRRFP